jgi:2EXR family
VLLHISSSNTKASNLRLKVSLNFTYNFFIMVAPKSSQLQSPEKPAAESNMATRSNVPPGILRFFELPQEVRTMIYELILPTDTFIHLGHWPYSRSVGGFDVIGKPMYVRANIRNTISALMFCQQAYREVTHLFYGKQEFEDETDDHHHELVIHKFIQSIRQKILLITKIKISFYARTFEVPEITKLISALNKSRSLKNFTIVKNSRRYIGDQLNFRCKEPRRIWLEDHERGRFDKILEALAVMTYLDRLTITFGAYSAEESACLTALANFKLGEFESCSSVNFLRYT